tara:strand:+ start:1680 stop:2108 length:429 start_codon:yes stop_codon:yes gene_type:complete
MSPKIKSEIEKLNTEINKLTLKRERLEEHIEELDVIDTFFEKIPSENVLKILKRLADEDYWKEFYISNDEDKWYVLIYEPGESTEKESWAKSEIFDEPNGLEKTLYALLNNNHNLIMFKMLMKYKVIKEENWLQINPLSLKL